MVQFVFNIEFRTSNNEYRSVLDWNISSFGIYHSIFDIQKTTVQLTNNYLYVIDRVSHKGD